MACMSRHALAGSVQRWSHDENTNIWCTVVTSHNPAPVSTTGHAALGNTSHSTRKNTQHTTHNKNIYTNCATPASHSLYSVLRSTFCTANTTPSATSPIRTMLSATMLAAFALTTTTSAGSC